MPVTFKPHPVLDEPKFLLSDVAFAAEVSQPVLKAWLSREPRVVALGPYDRHAFGKGSSRVFTLRTAILIALIAELVRLGITPLRAGALSFMATNRPEGDHGLDWDRFAGPESVLIAYAKGNAFAFVPQGTALDDVLETQPWAQERPASFVAVSIGRVGERVEARLRSRGK
jgi:hypothetical protein